MTAVSPGTIGVFHPNQYYRSYEAYMHAVAGAMRTEYEEIVRAGFILQIDCPDLAMGRHSRFKHMDDAQFLRCAELHVDVLNDAVANIPADRMRMHVCWGNYEGPHTHDIPLQKILPLVLRAKPGALLIEGANPRHEHEWELWTTCRLPDDKVLVPGVIDTSTNYVEHPELVAQRITRYANVVGRERVIGRYRLRAGDVCRIRPGSSRNRMGEVPVAHGRWRELASSRLWKHATPPCKLFARSSARLCRDRGYDEFRDSEPISSGERVVGPSRGAA